MLKALSKIREVIEGDSVIQSLLSSYMGAPAYAFGTAPDDMEMPYVVGRIDANNPDDVEILDRMILSFEVYFHDGDELGAFSVAERIAELINNVTSIADEIVSISRSGDLPVPDETPNVVHLSCKYLIRIDRTKLYIQGGNK